MAKFSNNDHLLKWSGIITLTLIIMLVYCKGVWAQEAVACPEGGKCAPSRPTLAQCAERISLETGDTTYADLINAPQRLIPLERAKAIADHSLCYGGAVPFIDAGAIDPGPGGWTRTAPALFSYRKQTVVGLSFETTAVHNKVLAFLKHKTADGWVVDADTPPALYPISAEAQDHEFWAITKKGVRSYADWKNRLGIQVWLPLDDLNAHLPPSAPPVFGVGFAYRWNADLAFGIGVAVSDCSDPAVASCQYASLYGGVSWQVSLKRLLGVML
jgi:hypothetical protein